MKKIRLIMDHKSGNTNYKAGETIEVSDSEYEFIMECYKAQKQRVAPFVEAFKDEVKE